MVHKITKKSLPNGSPY